MKSSIREQKAGFAGSMDPMAGSKSINDGLNKIPDPSEQPLKLMSRRAGIRIGKMLSMAVLLILSTDACQFTNNVLKSSLSNDNTSSFFVSAQFGGRGFGGGHGFGGGGFGGHGGRGGRGGRG